LGAGVGGSPFATVESLFVFDDGTGPALLVGGGFSVAGGAPASCDPKRDGSGLTSVGSGGKSPVFAKAIVCDGRGPAPYVGGWMTKAANVAAWGIARWDGSAWSNLFSNQKFGVLSPRGFGAVYGLAAFDDGSGPALYVAGDFTTAGGIPAS